MNDDIDDPYRLLSEEEILRLPIYWWHCWLIEPIMRGDVPAIQRYLAKEPEGISVEDLHYYDPFYLAAKRPDPAVLRLLLNHWAVHPTSRVPPPDERGFSLLGVACSHGALKTVRYLLDEQPALASLQVSSASHRTPLLEASASFITYADQERDEILTKGIARASFDIQARRERIQRSEALVSLLLDRGASARDSILSLSWGAELATNDKDNDRDTVLNLAIARAGPVLLRRLLDEGADALATTSNYSHSTLSFYSRDSEPSSKITLLHLAAVYGNYPGIQVLVEHYAQRGMDMADLLARQDQLGRLPIHYAAAGWPGAIGVAQHSQDTPYTTNPTDDNTGDANTDIEIDANTMALLRILTDSGNPRLTNAQDKDGETPLHHALSPNLITGIAEISVARFLCTDLHASAKLLGRDGQTPLHRLWHGHPHNASSSTNIRLATLLLDLDQDYAAEVNAVDKDGNTPLHLAARHHAHAPAAKFLLDRGANVRIRNNRGRTPLHEAAQGDLGVAKISVEERIRAQYGMLAILCASVEGGLPLDRNWNVLVDEKDADGKTPREIAQERRATWRDDDAALSRPNSNW